MANQQLTVNLAMTADTSQAKRQLQDLQNTLKNLTTNALKNDSSLGLSKELQNANKLAAQLQGQLKNATLPSGNLDLTKFSQALAKSNTQLKDYESALRSLGAGGDAAFNSLIQSINNAEIPLRKTNGLLKDFATTLANTAKWQISSNIMHGLESGLNQAFRYAQNLNESLTNIRIVTGQTSDQMAAFADRANKAAQSLSTTTTAYTDAALIFYQQGLNDKQVEERTNATIKMAQATGDSATAVSSYMTAIWNNFDDGSKSLEHYADVITALGASTASSSSEISEGLSKFAAVAETTGLSYEYATASLATLVANTRESADTIGNSLKTIFSRIQGLKLGETLEDGVDLNKYSAALKTVGVDILDANGGLRDMDNILEDMAGKWQTISREQKMALAQTVGGTRQYNTLISLMDNWDDMQKNLGTAQNAEGTLQQQADIYAQSWEASQKRVQAVAESIYSSLIDEDFFIELNNLLAELLKGVKNFIDGIGGIKGVLASVGIIATTVFGNQIANSLNEFTKNTESARKKVLEFQKSANQLAIDHAINSSSASQNASSQIYAERARLQKVFIEQANSLNETELETARILMTQNEELEKEALNAQKVAAQARAENKRNKAEAGSYINRDNSGLSDMTKDRANRYLGFIESISEKKYALNEIMNSFKEIDASEASSEEKIQRFLEVLNSNPDIKWDKNVQNIIENIKKDLTNGDIEGALNKAFGDLKTSGLADYDQKLERFKDGFAKILVQSNHFNGTLKDAKALTDQVATSAEKVAKTEDNASKNVKAYKNNVEQLKDAFVAVGDKAASFGNMIVNIAKVGSQFTMAISSAQGFGESLANIGKEGESSIAILSSMFSTITSLGFAMKSLNDVLKASSVASFANPITAVITLLGIAASGYIALQGYEKKRLEQQREAAKDSQENAQALNEESDANLKLISSYNEAYSTWQETKSNKEEMAEAAKKVAEAYEIENEQLLLATGNYEALGKAVEEARKKESQEVLEKNQKSFNDMGSLYLQEAEKNKKINFDENKISYRTQMTAGTSDEAIDAYLITHLKDNTQRELVEMGAQTLENALALEGELIGDAREKIRTQIGEEIIPELQDIFNDIEGIELNDDGIFSIEQEYEGFEDKVNKTIGLYEKIDEAAKAYYNKQDLNTWIPEEDAIYQGLILTLGSLKESYDGAKEAKDGLLNSKAYNSAFSAFGGAKDASDINEIMAQEVKKLVDDGYQVEEAREAIYDYLQDTSKSEIAKQAQMFEQIAEINDSFKTVEDVQKFYDSLPENEKTFFFQIKIDEKTSTKNMKTQMAHLRKVAEQDESQSTVNAAKSAKDIVEKSSSSISEKDMQELHSSLEWGKNGLIEFNEFAAKNRTEQTKIIEDYYNKVNEENLKLLERNKKAYEKEAEDFTKWADKNTKKSNLFQALLGTDSPEVYAAALEQLQKIYGDDWGKIQKQIFNDDGSLNTENIQERIIALETLIANERMSAEEAQKLAEAAENDIEFQAILDDYELQQKIKDIQSKEIKIGVKLTSDDIDALREMLGDDYVNDKYRTGQWLLGKDNQTEILERGEETQKAINGYSLNEDLTNVNKSFENPAEKVSLSGTQSVPTNVLEQVKAMNDLVAETEQATALEQLRQDVLKSATPKAFQEALNLARENVYVDQDWIDETEALYDLINEDGVIAFESVKKAQEENRIEGEAYTKALKEAFNTDTTLTTDKKLEIINEMLRRGGEDAQWAKQQIDALINEAPTLQGKLDTINNSRLNASEKRQLKFDAFKNEDNLSDIDKFVGMQSQANQAEKTIENLKSKLNLLDKDGEAYNAVQKRIQEAELELKSYEQDLKNGEQAVKNFILSLQDLKIGDSIDENAMKNLMDLAPELSGYFKQSIDGSYQLVSGVNEVKLAFIDLLQLTSDEDGNRLFSNEQILDLATTLGELKSITTQIQATDDEYIDSLIRLGLQHEESAKEAEVLRSAEQSLMEAQEERQKQRQILTDVQHDRGEDIEEIKAETEARLANAQAIEQEAQAKVDSAKYSTELAVEAIDQAAAFDLDATQVKNLAEYYKTLADAGEEGYETLKDNAEAAVDMARGTIRLNAGIQDLSKNYSSYSKILNTIQKEERGLEKVIINSPKEYQAMTKALSNLLNVSEDMINAQTLQKMSMKDIESASKGEAKGIENLKNVIVDYVGELNNVSEEGIEAFKELMGGKEEGEAITLPEINDSEFINSLLQAELDAQHSEEAIQDALSNIGIECDNVRFFNDLNEARAWAEETGNELIEDLSFNANPQTDVAQETGTTEDVGFDELVTYTPSSAISKVLEDGATETKDVTTTYMQAHKTVTPKVEEEEQTAEAPIVAVGLENPHTGKKAGGNIAPPSGGSGGRGGGGGGRRGGGRAPRAQRKTANVVRSKPQFKREQNAVAKAQKAYDNLEKAMDRSFGKGRLKIMQAQIDATKKLAEETEKYYKKLNEQYEKEKKRVANGQSVQDKKLEIKGIKQNKEGNDIEEKDITIGWKKINYKKTFGQDMEIDDETGQVVNSDKMLKNADKKIRNAYQKMNKARRKYNNDTTNASKRKAYVKAYNAWAKLVGKKERLEEDIETIEESASSAHEQFDNTLQAHYDAWNKEVEAVELKVEMKIEVDDDKLKVIDHYFDKYSRNAWNAANAIEQLTKKPALLQDKLNHNLAGINGVLAARGLNTGAGNVFDKDGNNITKLLQFFQGPNGQGLSDAINKELDQGLNASNLAKKYFDPTDSTKSDEENEKAWRDAYNSLTQEDFEKIDGFFSNMFDQISDYYSMMESAYGAFDNYINKQLEEYDNLIAKVEFLNQTTQHYINLVGLIGKSSFNKLLGGTGANDILRGLYDKQFEGSKQDIKVKRDEQKRLKKEMEDFYEQNKQWIDSDNDDDDNVREMKARYRQLEENYRNAAGAFQESLEASLTLAAEIYKNKVELIVEEMEQEVAGLEGSLEALQAAYDQSKETSSTYVKDYERVYQLNKLSRDISRSMDEATNIKAKRELLKLQDQINKKKNEEKEISEYELEYLRKQYELRLAQIALEEAQNAKTTVRYTRDSEGNSSYVYTLNEDDRDKAIDEYEDKIYEMQQLSENRIDEQQSKLLAIQSSFANRVREIGEMYEVGTKEYNTAMTKAQEEYTKYFQENSSELSLAINNNNLIYDQEVSVYEAITGKKKWIDNDYISNFEQTLLSQKTGFNDLNGWVDASAAAMAKATNEAIKIGKEYSDSITSALDEAGLSVETLAETMNHYVAGGKDEEGSFANQINTLDTNLNGLGTKIKSTWDSAAGSLSSFATTWDTEIAPLIASIEEAYTSYTKIKGDIYGHNENNDPQQPGTNQTNQGQKDSLLKEKEGLIKQINTIQIEIDGNKSKITDITSKKDKEKSKKNPDKEKIKVYDNQIKEYKNLNKDLDIKLAGYRKSIDNIENRLASFDTGGYTGEWGDSSGRLAMLHQKELILNKDDTSNMLKMVNMIRDITKTIDLNALTQSGGLASMISNSISSITKDQVFEQNVHITAEFPNATDRNEILSAFDNVINLASQYRDRR